MSVPSGNTLLEQRDRLLAMVRQLGSVAVAFSGGIDSTVVAKAAFIALGERAVAVTADSPSVARSEIADAIRLAQLIGIRHQMIATQEFANPSYLQNDGSRCYHCKTELYSQITSRLAELGVAVVCSGANLDDQGDYRPGLTAAAEQQVRHPLQEAGLTKADVRALARHWDLPTWDKPAAPCLASRIAPGVAVTPERTTRIEAAEAWLKGHGFAECRVRLHTDDLVRIEVPAHSLEQLTEPSCRQDLLRVFQELGFRYITLDLQGFRSGSLNALVQVELKDRFAIPGASKVDH